MGTNVDAAPLREAARFSFPKCGGHGWGTLSDGAWARVSGGDRGRGNGCIVWATWALDLHDGRGRLMGWSDVERTDGRQSMRKCVVHR